MKRIGQRNNIRRVFNSKETLRSKLVNFKPKKEPKSAKEVIYEIQCECGKSYIGETGRKLETRLKEHKASLRRWDPEISKLTEHSVTLEHRFKFEEAQSHREGAKLAPEKSTWDEWNFERRRKSYQHPQF
jgi:hypothetical protein